MRYWLFGNRSGIRFAGAAKQDDAEQKRNNEWDCRDPDNEAGIGVPWLDRAPKGRNETGVWWKRHDSTRPSRDAKAKARQKTAAVEVRAAPAQHRTAKIACIISGLRCGLGQASDM